jgi:PUA-domain protein
MKQTLSKKQIKELIPLLEYPLELSPKQKFEIISNKHTLLYIDDKPRFFQFGERWLPSLRLLMENNPYRKVAVDMGAIKFVASGADIMRPGVTRIDEGISAGDPVAVVDEKYEKILAIGIALYSSEEMRSLSSGKVVKNAHAAGDKLWELTA